MLQIARNLKTLRVLSYKKCENERHESKKTKNLDPKAYFQTHPSLLLIFSLPIYIHLPETKHLDASCMQFESPKKFLVLKITFDGS